MFFKLIPTIDEKAGHEEVPMIAAIKIDKKQTDSAQTQTLQCNYQYFLSLMSSTFEEQGVSEL